MTDEITPSPRMMRFLGLRKSRTKRIFTYLVQIYSTSANLFTWSESIIIRDKLAEPRHLILCIEYGCDICHPDQGVAYE